MPSEQGALAAGDTGRWGPKGHDSGHRAMGTQGDYQAAQKNGDPRGASEHFTKSQWAPDFIEVLGTP